MSEKVSVITPSYNSAKFIEETIESVVSQTHANWEMLIVDDCSIDNSVEIITKFMEKDDRISLIKLERNRGPALARNEAVKAAKGRYVAFLDSDDLWLPKKLEIQLDFMKSNGSILSYTSYSKIDEYGNIGSFVEAPQKLDYKQLLRTCSIGILTAMYDTRKIGKIYMPDIFSVEDYALWLKITKKGYTAYGLNEKLALYRVRKHGISSNKFRKAGYQWRVYRKLENLSILRSLYYMFFYAYYGYKKFRL